MTANLLSQIPLFADLPLEELDKIVSALDVKEIGDREILFREGDTGEEFYVVLRGEIEVLKAEGEADEMVLNVLKAGEYCGEMSLIMPGGHRTASVRARGDAALLSISRAQFLDLTRKYPRLSRAVARVLSERLDAANTQTFHELTEKNRQLQAAYDELKAAQAQLIEKERLERELQVAADIQLSILPDELPVLEGFDFGSRILPARQVGGDFYDVFLLDEDKVGVLIGDVADKGVPSAIFMARAHAFIMAEADAARDAGATLQRVNSHITRLQKSVQFVTVLYGILDVKTRVFRYARAGHEPPLIFYDGGTAERIPHKPGMALGLWDPVVLDEREVELSCGSTLLLFTDGMTDCRSPSGDPFGLERIKTALAGLSDLSAQRFCDSLLGKLINFQGGLKQDDDVTLVAIRAI